MQCTFLLVLVALHLGLLPIIAFSLLCAIYLGFLKAIRYAPFLQLKSRVFICLGLGYIFFTWPLIYVLAKIHIAKHSVVMLDCAKHILYMSMQNIAHHIMDVLYCVQQCTL